MTIACEPVNYPEGRQTVRGRIWVVAHAIMLCAVLGTAGAPGHAATPCFLGDAPYTKRVFDGASITLYSAPSVPKGASCDQIAVTATCHAGGLVGEGTARYPGCMALEGFTGLNLNESTQVLDERMLPDTGAKYVRAFIDVIKVRAAIWASIVAGNKVTAIVAIDPASWQTMRDTTAIGSAKMILNLKFDFRTNGFHPPLPGSTRESSMFYDIDHQILDPIAGSLAIIVSGNEPFVDTLSEDWLPQAAYGGIPLVVFYTRMTTHINNYLVYHKLRSKVKLFVGAFTRLEAPLMQQQPAAVQLLDFADKAPYVDGVDLHLHVKAIQDMDTALHFAQSLTIKPFIVTEYTYSYEMQGALSMGLPLGETFGQRWNLPPAMKELDFLRCNVFHFGPQCYNLPMILPAEWYDFIATRSWFEDHFLLQADAIFRRYRVVGATFGTMQGAPGPADLQPTFTPWYLGFLYSPIAIGYQVDGMPQPNFQYRDDFRQLTGTAN